MVFIAAIPENTTRQVQIKTGNTVKKCFVFLSMFPLFFIPSGEAAPPLRTHNNNEKYNLVRRDLAVYRCDGSRDIRDA